MDRKNRRVTYLTGANATFNAYGMNDDQKKKKNKKKNTIQSRIRMAILIFALIGVLIVCVIYALTGSTREGVGRVTRIGATLSQNVSPFGDSVIFYDGTTLHCVAATGGNEWSYQIGTNADYDATEKRIVAWSGNDLYILNNRGRLIYNNKMSDTVQFASAGDEYVAVFVGEADNGVVSVINSSGQIVDNITVSNQTLLDIGFFMASTANNTQPTELMWMLGLNTTGTVLSTELQTFQPGKLSTGKSSIGEHIAYSIYDDSGTLNVVTTRQILHYSYRALLCGLFLWASMFSGALSLGREAVSGYQLFSANAVAAGDWIRENTDRDDVFLTGQQHINPVCSLAGRQIICGSDLYVFFHGLDYSQQSADCRRFYEAPRENADVLETYNVHYIYVSDYERAEFDVDLYALDEAYELIYANDDVRIYDAGWRETP